MGVSNEKRCKIKNILLISIIFMHFFMITNNKYRKYTNILAISIYTYIGLKLLLIINRSEFLSNLEILKLIGSFILFIHYLQESCKNENIDNKIN